MDDQARIAELERRLETIESELGFDLPVSHIARLKSNVSAHRERLRSLESARGQAGEGDAKGSNVKVVDRREWEVLIEERDAAILEMGARDNEIYKLSNILLVCYGGPVQGETACEMAARLLKELKAERDAAVRERDEKQCRIRGYAEALAHLCRLAPDVELDANDLYGNAVRIVGEVKVREAQSARLRAAAVRLKEACSGMVVGEGAKAAVREIVALVGEEAKT